MLKQHARLTTSLTQIHAPSFKYYARSICLRTILLNHYCPTSFKYYALCPISNTRYTFLIKLLNSLCSHYNPIKYYAAFLLQSNLVPIFLSNCHYSSLTLYSFSHTLYSLRSLFIYLLFSMLYALCFARFLFDHHVRYCYFLLCPYFPSCSNYYFLCFLSGLLSICSYYYARLIPIFYALIMPLRYSFFIFPRCHNSLFRTIPPC